MSVMSHFLRWTVGLASAQTQTTPLERACLVRHAQGCRRLAEIGVWHGVTTRLLRQSMAPEGVLFAIDPFPAGRIGFSFQKLIAQSEVGKESNGTVRWLRLTGELAALEKDIRLAPIDFLFIDGDHSFDGIRADWEAWSPLMSDGGVIALHDSRSTPERLIDGTGSVQFTRGVILPDPRFRVVDEVDSVTVFRRTKNCM